MRPARGDEPHTGAIEAASEPSHHQLSCPPFWTSARKEYRVIAGYPVVKDRAYAGCAAA